MRNRIKQLLKKEDGFTLVELLGVIVILGLLIAIAIPSISGVMEKAQANTDKAQIELINDAAELYFVENPTEETVKISELVSLNFLGDDSIFTLNGDKDAPLDDDAVLIKEAGK